MAKKKKQHYIPQFYLRYFVDKNKDPKANDFVWVCERADGQIYRKSPKNICQKSYFYSTDIKDEMIEEQALKIREKDKVFSIPEVIEEQGGLKKLVIAESLYQKIESKGSIILNKIIGGDCELENQEWYDLSKFIAFLSCRTPKIRDKVILKGEEIWKDIALENCLSDRERLDDFLSKNNLTFELFCESVSKMKIRHPKEVSIAIEIEFGKDLHRPLFCRRRSLLTPKSDNISFITSDHPVVPINQAGQYVHSHPDLGIIETDFIFPISPKHCLRLSCSDKRIKKDGEVQSISDDKVIGLNRSIANYSYKYIFANNNNFDFLLGSKDN